VKAKNILLGSSSLAHVGEVVAISLVVDTLGSLAISLAQPCAVDAALSFVEPVDNTPVIDDDNVMSVSSYTITF
jgi:hypothetical protein